MTNKKIYYFKYFHYDFYDYQKYFDICDEYGGRKKRITISKLYFILCKGFNSVILRKFLKSNIKKILINLINIKFYYFEKI
jgi:hypothetical protein